MFRLVSAALALALIGSVAVPPSDPALASGTTVEVQITVLGPDGEPFVTTGEAGVDVAHVNLHPVPVGSSIGVDLGPDGTATIVVPAGSYRGELYYRGSQNVLDQWSGGVATQAEATISTFVAGEPASMDFTFEAGATVTGEVRGDGFELVSGAVSLVDGDGDFMLYLPRSYDPETETYSVTRVPPGTYYVNVSGSASSGDRVESRWLGNVLGPPQSLSSLAFCCNNEIGETVELTNGQTFVVDPMTLNYQSVISGTVEFEETPGPGLSFDVEIWADGTKRGERSMMFSAGRFQFYDVARYPGEEWSVCLKPRGDWYRTCWSIDGAARLADAGVLTPGPNERITGLVIEARRGGSIRIDARYDLDGPGGTAPAWSSSFQARAFTVDPEAPEPWRTARLDSEVQFDSSFTSVVSGAVPPGAYLIEMVDEQRPILGRTFLKDDGTTTPYLDEASVFTVARVQQLALSTVLRPLDRAFDRIAGSDRFAGAVAISREMHADASAPVVYIANGLTFPDALAAGPAVAADGGSLLLVTTTSIPPVVAQELERLQPSTIVIVGGLGTVGAAVEAQLRTFVDEFDQVERRSGADRYETSRKVVEGAFGDSPERLPVFIATGAGYADALAAGAAAGVLGGPVVLVDGSRTSIDLATRTLIDNLEPSAIFIAGGAGSVSTSIEGALRSRYEPLVDVYRLAGPDRYSTAVAINQLFAESALAFVASGEGFADALAGAPLAAAVGAPLYLTRPQCLPRAVSDDLTALRVATAVIIGGTGVVRQSVEFGTIC